MSASVNVYCQQKHSFAALFMSAHAYRLRPERP